MNGYLLDENLPIRFGFLRWPLLVFVVCALLWPLTTAWAWSSLPGGEFTLNLVGMPSLLGVGLCIPLMLLGGALLVFARFRRRGIVLTTLCFAFVTGSLLGIWISFHVARMGWHQVTARAEALISAIHAYEQRSGAPPSSLELLVPSDLAEVPTTGLGNLAPFHYRRAEGTNLVMGDRWALRVNPPQIGLGFDTLFYIPSEQYPERGFGGRIERVGRWAYVHE